MTPPGFKRLGQYVRGINSKAFTVMYPKVHVTFVSPMPAGIVARFERYVSPNVFTGAFTSMPQMHRTLAPDRRLRIWCQHQLVIDTLSMNAGQGNVSHYYDVFSASSLIQNVGSDGLFISWISTPGSLNLVACFRQE
jgi:hypothetical protein